MCRKNKANPNMQSSTNLGGKVPNNAPSKEKKECSCICGCKWLCTVILLFLSILFLGIGTYLVVLIHKLVESHFVNELYSFLTTISLICTFLIIAIYAMYLVSIILRKCVRCNCTKTINNFEQNFDETFKPESNTTDTQNQTIDPNTPNK